MHARSALRQFLAHGPGLGTAAARAAMPASATATKHEAIRDPRELEVDNLRCPVRGRGMSERP